MCWSVAPTGCSCHCWVQVTLVTFTIRTSTPRREWTSGKASRNSRYSLSLLLSATSNTLHVRTTLLIVVSANVICSAHPLLVTPSGLNFLLHNGIWNCLVTFLHSVNGCLYLCSPLSPTNWTAQAKLNILYIVIEEPFLEGMASDEQDSFPWQQNYGFSDSIPRKVFL